MNKTTRKIVHIDQDKCNGCGLCIPNCAEGAIQIVDGKAQLVSDVYCDGLGACLGNCPLDAIQIIEREAEEFDEQAVHEHLARTGQDPLPAPAHAPHNHGHAQGGCPGSAVRTFDRKPQPIATAPAQEGGCPSTLMQKVQQMLHGQAAPAGGGCPGKAMRSFGPGRAASPQARPATPGQAEPSALSQWPVQLMLVPPHAPFLQGADLLLCADCVPFAVPDFHSRFLAGRAVLVGCPKLDDLDHYRQKLRQVLAQAQPTSLTVVRMEVPCCAGIVQALVQARDEVAPDLSISMYTVGIEGGTSEQII